ncbi:hypothetical protein COO60DRAFT_1554666 [Scenedesmus sp. NREL 46B-D3]|nr:hypothetical protein COO60DRAFT_1554666 [Scenedesmus sp. NREL 46B-D3]
MASSWARCWRLPLWCSVPSAACTLCRLQRLARACMPALVPTCSWPAGPRTGSRMPLGSCPTSRGRRGCGWPRSTAGLRAATSTWQAPLAWPQRRRRPRRCCCS